MTDFSHFDAIHARFLRESARLAEAHTPGERAFREIQVAQALKEMADELTFLGCPAPSLADMSDDELLAELGV